MSSLALTASAGFRRRACLHSGQPCV